MDLKLAAMYNTPGAASQEDMAKAASFELFAKLASENGIDLGSMSAEERQYLYDNTMGKAAGENPFAKKDGDEDDDDDDKKDKEEHAKKEKAAAEFAATQEWQGKFAEADQLGRVMAHAYVHEMNSIKEAGKMDALKNLAGKAGKMDALKNFAGKAGDAASKGLERLGKKGVGIYAGGGEGAMSPATARRIGGGIAAAGAAGTAAAVHKMSKKKESSAIDSLALDYACKLANETGFDVEEAGQRVLAVHTLGLGESTKLASAQDVDGAVHVRALEYLEAAGYPVSWEG